MDGNAIKVHTDFLESRNNDFFPAAELAGRNAWTRERYSLE